MRFDNRVLVHLRRQSCGWSDMRSENNPVPVNPYESPREANVRMPPLSKAAWVGPLLAASVGLFCSAICFSAITFTEQDRLIQIPLVASLTLAGAICLVTSFGLHRRERHRVRAEATYKSTSAPNAPAAGR